MQEVYAGSWKNDKFHGHGVYLYDNFEIYEGDLNNGAKNGHGMYYYKNGNRFEGEFIDNFKVLKIKSYITYYKNICY